MTDHVVHLVVPMSPEGVEESRRLFDLVGHYPNEVAEVAGALAAVAKGEQELEERVAPIVSRLLAGSKVAHEGSVRLRELMDAGRLHECEGAIQ